MTLVLKVSAPQDGATVTASPVTVSGRVGGSESKGARVKINEADVALNDLKFSADVPLTEGKNTISVVATTGTSNVKEQLNVTYAPAKK